MASTLAWPRTPSAPSSSASSSSSRLPTNSFSSSPPPHPASSFEALLRTPPPSSSSSYAAAQGLYTPPSSPPLPPLQPTPTSSRTLHLRSPHKPTGPPARSTLPLPASSPSSSRRKQQLIVKGNVTPSRASAFFHPRPQRRDAQGPSCTPSSTRGYYASLTSSSPSSHTSARRGVKRQRRPEESIPESPSSTRRGRRDRMMLEGEGAGHWDDSSDDDDEDAGQMGDRRWFDWGASDDEELMSLATPAPRSMARRGPTSPSLGSAARRAGLPSSQPSRTRHQQRTSGVDWEATPSPRKPVPMAMRASQTGADLASAMATLRCGAGGGAGRGMSAMNALRNRVSHVSAYQTYRSHPDHSIYTLPSLANGGETLNQPLACAYSYSSRSYTSSRQWLAVGDNEGVLTLLDTSRDQTLSTYRSIHDGPADRPTWQATIGSLFSVSWRFDDAYLASSGSDYTTKIWDTSTLSCVHSFVGSRGTSRAIEWDPHSGGNLLASGGRDGAIHVYDLRMAQKEAVISTGSTVADDDHKLEPTSPLLSLWSAHAPSPALTATGFRARSTSNMAAKGVTSLIYHPHRPHALFTAGCADATIKLWDLRFAVDSGAEQHQQQQQRASETARKASSKFAGDRIPFADLSGLTNSTSTSSSASSVKRKTRKPRKARPGDPSFVLSSTASANPDSSNGGTGLASDPLEIKPLYESGDLSLSVGKAWNARSHGISCLSQGGGKIFAAATDGRIYSLPLSSLAPSPGSSTSFVNEEEATVLYHPTQLGNSLYNRLALCPDERTLAIGCNNGSVVLWDTKAKSAAVLGSAPGAGSASRSRAAAARHGSQEESEEDDDEEEGGNPFSRPGPASRRGPASSRSNFNPPTSGARSGSGGGGSGGGAEGHRLNCEINALDWCYDAYAGWRLASCGDDMTVRVWEAELRG